MKAVDFQRFVFENKIKQSFLAEYLGVSAGYISSVVSGRKELSDDKLGKVLNNPYGWDITHLSLGDLADEHIDIVSNTLVDYLQKQVADKDALIAELYKQIGALQEKLNSVAKGETASIVDSSSTAHAG